MKTTMTLSPQKFTKKFNFELTTGQKSLLNRAIKTNQSVTITILHSLIGEYLLAIELGNESKII